MVAFAYGAVNAEAAVYPTSVKTSAYTASPGDYVACSISAGSFTVQLPNAPANGTRTGVKVVATNAAGTNVLTVACQGSDRINVSGGSTSAPLSLLDQGTIFQYESGIWIGTDDSLPLSQLDARYATLGVALDAYGADPTGGAYSDAAMTAALAALGSAAGSIVLAPGATYKFTGSYAFGPGQGLTCSVPGRTCTLYYYGSGVFIHARDPLFNTGTTSPLASPSGQFTGIIIDGTSAGTSAKGFQLGDLNCPFVDIGVQNFTGASAIGTWLCSTIGWVNYGTIRVATNNCTTHVQFDNQGGGGTFGGTAFEFVQTAAAGQAGVKLVNGCQPTGGSFELYGGYNGGASNSGRVLSIGEDGSNAGFRNMSPFNVDVEADSGTGSVGPVTVVLGAASYFMQNSGQLAFRNFGSSFQASSGLGNYRFAFSGWIQSDTSDFALGNPGVNGYGLVTQGGSLWAFGSTDATHIYLGTGDFYQTVLASGANTVAVANTGSGRPFRLTWHVIQPASGAAGTLTLTGAKTTSGSGALTLSATNGDTDVVEVWSLDGTSVFAAVKGLNFH